MSGNLEKLKALQGKKVGPPPDKAAMEWNRYPETKPPNDQMCYVCHERAGMDCFLAIYWPKYNIFRLYDPRNYDHPALDVTHWIPLPTPPRTT